MKSLIEIINADEGRFFYRNGEKVYLKPVVDKVLVKFNDNLSIEKKNKAFESLKEKVGLVPTHKLNDDSIKGIFHLMNVNHNQPHLREAVLKKELNVDVVESNINFLGSVFENIETNTYLALTNQLFVKLKTANDLETLRDEFDKYGVSNLENMQNNLYLLTLSEKAELDALEIANNLSSINILE